MFEASLAETGGRVEAKRVRTGEVVTGTVVSIGMEAVFVDVGTRSEGQIARHELEDKKGELTVQVGDRVRATVAQGGDRPTLVVAFGRGMDHNALEMAAESGAPVTGTVQKAVKGGLEVDLGGARAFCPASHVDRTYVEDLSVFEGQEMAFRVIEVRDGGRSIVVSRRAIIDAEREVQAAEAMSKVSEGAILEGTVSSIQAYGAFVDLGGIEGLVHISELGAGHVASVNDVVQVGESVQVKVLGIEEVEGKRGVQQRIKLSMRAAGGGGQSSAPSRGEQVLEATVTKVEPFGVFVQTEGGGGLVPSRELDLPPGGDPRRAYPVGKAVKVVSLGADPKGNARYSIRRVEDAEARAAYKAFAQNQGGGNKGKGGGKKALGSLGDLLKAKLGDIEAPPAPKTTAKQNPETKATASAKPAERSGKSGKRTRIG